MALYCIAISYCILHCIEYCTAYCIVLRYCIVLYNIVFSIVNGVPKISFEISYNSTLKIVGLNGNLPLRAPKTVKIIETSLKCSKIITKRPLELIFKPDPVWG